MRFATLVKRYTLTPMGRWVPIFADETDPNEPGDDEWDSQNECSQSGSILYCFSQALGEKVPIVGTNFDMVYDSGRVKDRAEDRRLHYSVGSVDYWTNQFVQSEIYRTPEYYNYNPLRGAATNLTVAGRKIRYENCCQIMVGGFHTCAGDTTEEDCHAPFSVDEDLCLGPPEAPCDAEDLVKTWEWDGLDAYGREVFSSANALVQVGTVYDIAMRRTGMSAENSFFDALQAINPGGGEIIGWEFMGGGGGGGGGAAGGWSTIGNSYPGSTGPISTNTMTMWAEYETTVGTYLPKSMGLGGWTIAVHHFYDPLSQTLHKGDGTTAYLKEAPPVIQTVERNRYAVAG